MTRPTRQGARPSPMTLVVTLALLSALLVLPLTLAPRAEAFVYWTNAATQHSPPTIGRANLDGTGVTERFIDLDAPAGRGIAVDAEHIYWGTDGAIARANLDGTGVDPDFITIGYPVGVSAVDAHHIYWTHGYGIGGTQGYGIGRANLDGTGVNPDFITTAGSPSGVAVDAEHIYWTQGGSLTPPPNTAAIGRANLDGTGVNQDFITTGPDYQGSCCVGPAVDADHIYWSQGGRTMARANLDGSGIDRSFIAVFDPGVLAVDAAHIYWTSSTFDGASSIARANLDGSGVPDFDFIPSTHIHGRFQAPSLAVDALTDTELVGDVTAAKAQKQRGNAIVVKVKLSADERLTAEAGGKIKVNPTYKLKRKKVELTGGETQTLKLRPKKAQARQILAALKQGESATAKLTVTLSDFAAHSEVEELRVRLKR